MAFLIMNFLKILFISENLVNKMLNKFDNHTNFKIKYKYLY